jgi:hypothetical protein
MGLFNRLVGASSNQGVQLIERWCAELGWRIDDRIGSDGIILDFNDPLIGIRKLLITVADGGSIAQFSVFSAANLNVRQLTGKLMAYLLCHNREIFGAWQMKINDDNTITLAVASALFVSGMSANEFKATCNLLVKEANDLDTKLNNSELS